MYKTTRNVAILGIGLSVSAVVGWLLLKENKGKPKKEPASVAVKSQVRPPEAEEAPQIVLPLDALDQATALAPDDLTRIKGIGPRFAQAIQAVGITSFAQLAAHTPDELADKLAAHVGISAGRIRDNNWIGQAAELATS
jgi:predicted flap endonuclease-1-like 5' DNA nuclease